MIFNEVVLENLTIEVTRLCNMNCPHCLRGDAQNKSMNIDYVRRFCSQLKGVNIRKLLLTGGEPTLVPDIVDDVLSLMYDLKFDFEVINIVTNGRNIPDRFIEVITNWRKFFNINIYLSLDNFHDSVTEEDLDKLYKLNCISKPNGVTDNNLIKLGKAREENLGKDYIPLPFAIIPYYNYLYIKSVIVLTCEGDILNTCDYEYSGTDNLKICRYDDDFKKVIFNTGITIANISDLPNSGVVYRWLYRLRKEGKLQLS